MFDVPVGFLFMCVHHMGGLKCHVTNFCADLILDGPVASTPRGRLRCHTPYMSTIVSPLWV